MNCAICRLMGVFAYVRVSGEFVCIPCASMAHEAYMKYILDVAHKAKRHPPSGGGIP